MSNLISTIKLIFSTTANLILLDKGKRRKLDHADMCIWRLYTIPLILSNYIDKIN
jgi:hypothetical protein